MNTNIIQEIIKEKSGGLWWSESEIEILNKYGKIFNPQNLDNLTSEDFKSFLLIKNNKHWEGIHRQGNLITSDMNKLRHYLHLLLNEKIPLQERLDQLFDKNNKLYIKGLGRAVITPILLVVYPQKYGVWNTKSEEALKKINLFPQLKSSDAFADNYIKVNDVLLELASQNNVSLWVLDGVLGEIAGKGPFEIKSDEEKIEEEAEEVGISDFSNFAMESHLEDFIISNWDRTNFGDKYKLIYDEGGDLLSKQYRTSVGPIDILAISKDDKEYLVIELKKGRTTDAVVGQILRYMTWIRENLAKENIVKGVVIVLETDDKLIYSLKSLTDVSLYTYKVDFKLNKENK